MDRGLSRKARRRGALNKYVKYVIESLKIH